MTPGPSNICCRKSVESIFRTRTKQELSTTTFVFQCEGCKQHWQCRGKGGKVTVSPITPTPKVVICDIEAAEGSHPDNCLFCGWRSIQEAMA